MQQASYLEGGSLMWMLPLYLHVNQKSDYDDMIYIEIGPVVSDKKIFKMSYIDI